jgi:DNA-binding response OmpR family regulator
VLSRRYVKEAPLVLVAEHDQAVQASVEKALSDAGFDCAIAQSGEEAVALFSDARTTYRALITGLAPAGRMDGWEVAHRLREIDPAFPIIYLSGENSAEWAANGVPDSVMIVMPFAPAQLITALAQLLNADKPPAAQ